MQRRKEKEEKEGRERNRGSGREIEGLWPGGSNLVNCRELERNREEEEK